MLQEGFTRRKQVRWIRVSIGRCRYRPSVTEPLPVDMEVWAWHLSSVRVAMERTVQVEPHKDNRLANSILIGRFGEFDLRSGHVEAEVLPLVD